MSFVAPISLGATEHALLDGWQRNFPLVERPFFAVGKVHGLSEEETIAAFVRAQATGALSRIGAVVRPNVVGASTLAAMQVPPERLEEVGTAVSAEPLVNHNYARTHSFNLWFVVAGPDTAAVAATLRRIEQRTGLPVLDLPMVQAYHLDLGFPLAAGTRTQRPAQADERAPVAYVDDTGDRRVLAAIEDGLPLVARPYRHVARRLDIDEKTVLSRLRHLVAAGVVSRFGCVVHHRALGFTANAMVVWDVPDQEVDAVAARFVANPRVTLCYRRPRRLPHWPYNLFCMVHARSSGDAHAAINDLNLANDPARYDQAILFSTRCFKQRGALFSQPAAG
ncbi:MAG: hypothetical protein IT539_11765 [Bradyrhizobiaceae bacterium]|nr:hypothetical protein [Bradyrhizobiaceae bacterium]